MRRSAVIVLVMIAAGRGLAETATGAGWLNAPLSVRQMGMGDVSLSRADVLQSWSNPALLAGQSTRGSLALNGGSLFGSAQTTMGLAAGWLVTPAWSLGLLASASSMSFAEVDAFGDPAGASIVRSETAGGLVSAYQFGWLHAGLTLKGVSDGLAGDTASTGAADVGAAAGFGRAMFGVAVRNLGGALRTGPAGDDVLPREIRGGASYSIAPLRVTAGAEMSGAPGGEPAVGAGAEWWPAERFGIRAGAAGLGPKKGLRITAGFSAVLSGFGIDYALATHPLGLTHNVSVSYGFGMSAAELAARVPEPEPVAEAVPVAKQVEMPAPSSHTGQLNLAVADLSGQNVSGGDAAVISDMLRSEMVKSGVFNVVEKQNMDKLLAEQAFQQTGCTSAECALKLGKMLNVHRMIVGSFGKLMDKYFISVRVVNIETGKIIYSDDANGRTVEDIQDGVRAVAKRMIKRIR